MSDTPDWLRRLMERDPTASDPTPLDDLTKHRMEKYLRESGKKQAAHEDRKLAILWTRWGLERHATSHHALRLAEPMVDDFETTGDELPAMMLAALCNFAMLRLAHVPMTWDKVPDLYERITGSYHHMYPADKRVVVTENRYQYVADALGLSGQDWPEINAIVREIYRLTYGSPDDDDPYDDQTLAELLHNVCDRANRPLPARPSGAA